MAPKDGGDGQMNGPLTLEVSPVLLVVLAICLALFFIVTRNTGFRCFKFLTFDGLSLRMIPLPVWCYLQVVGVFFPLSALQECCCMGPAQHQIGKELPRLVSSFPNCGICVLFT